MKKNYFTFGTIYCTFFLLVLLIFLSVFTTKKVSDTNSRYMTRFNWNPLYDEYLINDNVITIPEEFSLPNYIANSYTTWQYDYDTVDDVGFYSGIYDAKDYSLIAETRDCIEVMKVVSSEDGEQRTYSGRMMFLDQPLLTDEYFHRLITSVNGDKSKECVIEGARHDGTFMFDGTVTFNLNGTSRTYNIDIPVFVNEADAADLSDWNIGTNYHIENESFDSEVYAYNINDLKTARNKEAKELGEEYIENFRNGDKRYDTLLEENGFFTSRKVVLTNVDDGNYVKVTCTSFHPFTIVLKENRSLYIAALVIFLIIEAATIISIRKLYKNQKSFEIRSQKLTRGIAHELKTPLAITKACVENWEYIDENERKEYSDKIISEVDHMSGLITKLLDLSKLSTDKSSVNREKVDLMVLSESIVDRMDDLARERKLEITLSGEEGRNTFPVYADPEMMHIVISNFVSNAYKYADHSIRIKLSEHGSKVKFSIINDGTRIDKKDLAKVWDIFYKTDGSRSDRMSSSGVGLAVVKSILDLHNAKYGCYSDSEGTEFWFEISRG